MQRTGERRAVSEVEYETAPSISLICASPVVENVEAINCARRADMILAGTSCRLQI
jgi:hypothetical protein